MRGTSASGREPAGCMGGAGRILIRAKSRLCKGDPIRHGATGVDAGSRLGCSTASSLGRGVRETGSRCRRGKLGLELQAGFT